MKYIVNHHTGGLEIKRVGLVHALRVNHHTGGLETINNPFPLVVFVNHHTGGLETCYFPSIYHNSRQSPHRWFRKSGIGRPRSTPRQSPHRWFRKRCV